jgi:hypothetical protein
VIEGVLFDLGDPPLMHWDRADELLEAAPES